MDTKIMSYVGAAAGGVACIIGIVNAIRISKTTNVISDNIKVDIPKKILDAAMSKAADKACTDAAKDAANAVRSDINQQVKNHINQIHSNIEGEVRSSVEKQISLLTLEKIEKSVVDKVSRYIPSSYNRNGVNDIPSIVKACKEAGMSAWQIKEIVDNMSI